MSDRRIYLAAGIAAVLLSSGYGANPSFAPDTTFKGSILTGWHTLGAAEWRAQNGEITGNAKTGAGWLVLDRADSVSAVAPILDGAPLPAWLGPPIMSQGSPTQLVVYPVLPAPAAVAAP